MILYLVIIFICMFLISIFNIIFATSLTATYIIISTCLLTAGAYIIDLFISIIIFVLPKKWFNPFSKFYKVFNFERKFYEKIGIRKWKDLIPIGKGPIGIGFAKNKIENINSNEYLKKFLFDSCMAETMHLFSILLSFVLLLITPNPIIWNIGLPVMIVNIFLQLLPIYVQRYNRPKMITLYNRNLKQEKTNKKEEN